MKSLIKKIVNRFGFDIVPFVSPGAAELKDFPEITEENKKIISTVRPFTMTGIARIVSLIDAVSYLSTNNINGDIAECGVWRGGSMMTIALALMNYGDTNRRLFLYDTFEGMPEPTKSDKSFDGVSAEEQMKLEAGKWCYAGIDDVRQNLLSTGYPQDKIHFIKGKVEDTIPGNMPENLALLRLDTDWYESTKHELTHLYPVLSPSGVLIIDDYGHWQGARLAVDEYFSEQKRKVYLHRIDYTGRIAVGSVDKKTA